MTEWYVFMEGNLPRHIVMGRQEAIRYLTAGFRVSEAELRKVKSFLAGVAPALHEPFLLVGYERGDGSWTKDRSITRVTGPGAEV